MNSMAYLKGPSEEFDQIFLLIVSADSEKKGEIVYSNKKFNRTMGYNDKELEN